MVTKRNVAKGKLPCPFCGHSKAFRKVSSTKFGWFCSKCGKENKGTEKFTNKHGIERVRPV